MESLNDKENEECRREFAEKILCGEYSQAVIVLIDKEGNRHTWYDGGLAQCVGLANIGYMRLLQQATKD